MKCGQMVMVTVRGKWIPAQIVRIEQGFFRDELPIFWVLLADGSGRLRRKVEDRGKTWKDT